MRVDKVGVKVVCIKNNNYHILNYNLTIGKVYIIQMISTYDINICIISDDGGVGWYPSKWFVLLKEYRKMKLEVISGRNL